MKNYRVTKYNPKNRNSEGHYQLDEWTCPSDIGGVFNGVEFKSDEYFDIESKYIKSAIKLIESCSLNHLRVVSLYTNYIEEYFVDADYQWLLEEEFKVIKLFEDKPLNISEIETVLKMILRNFMGCSLEVDGKFKLHFGYDYYMYVSLPSIDEDTISYIESMGLYFEDLTESTLAYSYEYSIDIGSKDQEFVDDTIYLENITPDKIRKLLGLSIDHPCNHSFKITPDISSLFTGQIDFDFVKNDYFFSCSKLFN
jgi:hypothetical protein